MKSSTVTTSIRELKAMAKAVKLPKYSNLTKAELIEALLIGQSCPLPAPEETTTEPVTAVPATEPVTAVPATEPPIASVVETPVEPKLEAVPVIAPATRPATPLDLMARYVYMFAMVLTALALLGVLAGQLLKPLLQHLFKHVPTTLKPPVPTYFKRRRRQLG